MFLRAELGGTVTYVPGGWSFWRAKTMNYYVFAEGSVGKIENGSLRRFCTVVRRAYEQKAMKRSVLLLVSVAAASLFRVCLQDVPSPVI